MLLTRLQTTADRRPFHQDYHPWQENLDARLPLHDVIVINDGDHLAKTGENSEETIPVSDSFESLFIEELNGIRYQESEDLDHNIISEKRNSYCNSESL